MSEHSPTSSSVSSSEAPRQPVTAAEIRERLDRDVMIYETIRGVRMMISCDEEATGLYAWRDGVDGMSQIEFGEDGEDETYERIARWINSDGAEGNAYSEPPASLAGTPEQTEATRLHFNEFDDASLEHLRETCGDLLAEGVDSPLLRAALDAAYRLATRVLGMRAAATPDSDSARLALYILDRSIEAAPSFDDGMVGISGGILTTLRDMLRVGSATPASSDVLTAQDANTCDACDSTNDVRPDGKGQGMRYCADCRAGRPYRPASIAEDTGTRDVETVKGERWSFARKCVQQGYALQWSHIERKGVTYEQSSAELDALAASLAEEIYNAAAEPAPRPDSVPEANNG